ncbi:MAG: beta-L-arabinofuranosidase domain-containing protein [Thermoguttaceae bacterium]|jgi:DUF1680 family protein
MQSRWLSLVAGSLLIALLPLLPGLAADSAATRVRESKEKVAPLVTLRAEPFRLEDVRLLDGLFKHAMELDRKYLLSLEADRLLHVFRLRAGVPSTAKPYGGWMAPDHVSRGLVFDPKCRKEYCSPEDSFWCCTGTGVENHAKYGDSIYFRQGATGLYVNLFIASELSWQAKGLTLRQETKYPQEGRTRLSFTCAKPVELTLHIRHPYWAVSGFRIHINGVEQPLQNEPGSYATAAREWSSGDTVEVAMPFTLRTEAFRDNPRRVAFLRGPLVLCAGTKGPVAVLLALPSQPKKGGSLIV